MASENRKSPTSRLAQLIKELRGNASQREFSKLLGTSYTAIQDWEKEIRLPSSRNLQRLSQLKGWTEAELMNHLFSPDVQAEHQNVDPVEHIVSSLQRLSPEQKETLTKYFELIMKPQKSRQDDVHPDDMHK